MKKRRMKPSQALLRIWSDLIPSSVHQECLAFELLVLRSPQFSFTLGPPKFVRAQICVGDMRVSCLQVKGRQHHLSQNIGPAIAGSAGPVSPPL